MKASNFNFQDREGNTSLSQEERNGLLFSHIQKMGELDEAETLNIIHGLEFLRNYKRKDFLTVSFAIRLHKHLFGSVWQWAGKFRLTEKNIGVAPLKVQVSTYKLLENVKFWIENSTYSPIEISARFHHGLVWIHPFSNGNGRWARIYTDYICRRLDWEKPNWHFGEDPHERRHKYIEALRAADLKNFKPLITYISKIDKDG